MGPIPIPCVNATSSKTQCQHFDANAHTKFPPSMSPFLTCLQHSLVDSAGGRVSLRPPLGSTFFSFLWGHWCRCFGVLVMSALGSNPGWIPLLTCFFITSIQWTPQIHFWCNTCWPLGSQHDSRVIYNPCNCTVCGKTDALPPGISLHNMSLNRIEPHVSMRLDWNPDILDPDCTGYMLTCPSGSLNMDKLLLFFSCVSKLLLWTLMDPEFPTGGGVNQHSNCLTNYIFMSWDDGIG